MKRISAKLALALLLLPASHIAKAAESPTSNTPFAKLTYKEVLEKKLTMDQKCKAGEKAECFELLKLLINYSHLKNDEGTAIIDGAVIQDASATACTLGFESACVIESAIKRDSAKLKELCDHGNLFGCGEYFDVEGMTNMHQNTLAAYKSKMQKACDAKVVKACYILAYQVIGNKKAAGAYYEKMLTSCTKKNPDFFNSEVFVAVNLGASSLEGVRGKNSLKTVPKNGNCIDRMKEACKSGYLDPERCKSF